jgi:hypothetical protein
MRVVIAPPDRARRAALHADAASADPGDGPPDHPRRRRLHLSRPDPRRRCRFAPRPRRAIARRRCFPRRAACSSRFSPNARGDFVQHTFRAEPPARQGNQAGCDAEGIRRSIRQQGVCDHRERLERRRQQHRQPPSSIGRWRCGGRGHRRLRPRRAPHHASGWTSLADQVLNACTQVSGDTLRGT